MTDPMFDPPPITCDCGSEDIAASVEDVRDRGRTIVFTCGSCNRAWANTEPSIAEMVIANTQPLGRTWT